MLIDSGEKEHITVAALKFNCVTNTLSVDAHLQFAMESLTIDLALERELDRAHLRDCCLGLAVKVRKQKITDAICRPAFTTDENRSRLQSEESVKGQRRRQIVVLERKVARLRIRLWRFTLISGVLIGLKLSEQTLAEGIRDCGQHCTACVIVFLVVEIIEKGVAAAVSEL